MSVTVVTIAFLVVAILVAVGILAAVALPRLRRRDDHDESPRGHGQDREAAARGDRRHRSRTRR